MNQLHKALASTAFVALTACSGSVSVGGSGISQGNLETEVSTRLEESVGQAPDDVSCPGGLDAEVGATQRCTLTSGEDVYGIDVEATAVADDVVTFDIQVDDAPSGG